MATILEEHGLVFGLEAEKVFARLRRARDQEGFSKRTMAFFLTEVKSRDLLRTTAFESMENFAYMQLEMESRRCREYAQVGRALLDMPVLDRAYLAGDVSWSKVLLVMRVAQRETQVAWTEFAKENSYHDLRGEVAVCEPGDLPGEGGEHALLHMKTKYVHFLSETNARVYEQLRTILSADKDETLNDNELLAELVQIAADALTGDTRDTGGPAELEETSKPLPFEERNHEELPADVRQAVLRRDGYECGACHKKYDLHVHHILSRSWGGDNSMSNLATVCIGCHTSIHLGYLITEGNPETRAFRFLMSNGQPLHRTSGDRVVDPSYGTGVFRRFDPVLGGGGERGTVPP